MNEVSIGQLGGTMNIYKYSIFNSCLAILQRCLTCMIVHVLIGHARIYNLFIIKTITGTEITIFTINTTICCDDIIILPNCTNVAVYPITFVSYSNM